MTIIILMTDSNRINKYQTVHRSRLTYLSLSLCDYKVKKIKFFFSNKNVRISTAFSSCSSKTIIQLHYKKIKQLIMSMTVTFSHQHA